MTSATELRDTVEAALTELGLDAETIERNPSSTIVPPRTELDSGQRAYAALVGGLEELDSSSGAKRLEVGETIGEGGMGVVRVGTQTALGRKVAVKSVKPALQSEETTLKLLREAWVTGGLEHPNVVPVYDIALGADQHPLIILKKIEGDEWRSLLHDAAMVKERFGVDDLLEWNLRILMQVCNAVRFAHSRGILHRDLKPENVMVGSFGEVYVVDWGLALSLHDRDGRLPLASDACIMAGTPLYMAPEMLGGRPGQLSERTDTYLLGSILYEVVCGSPPHQADTFMLIALSIAASDPQIPPDVPSELARIIRRAMDRDPDARFENPEQIRLALQAFLEHRDAARLADRALERLNELDALLADNEQGTTDAREEIYRLFGECRFGFRQALEVWPQHEEAARQLDRAASAMIEYELRQSEPEAAHSLLSGMVAVPEELAERVRVARQKRRTRDSELRRLHADLDPAAGHRARAGIAVVIGVLWTVVPWISHTVIHNGLVEFNGLANGAVGAAFLIVLMGVGFWARESMTRTAINRRIGMGSLLGMAVQMVTGLSGHWLEQDPWEVVHGQFVAFTIICAMLAVSVDRRLWVAAAAYAAGYVAIPLVGMQNTFVVMGLCNLGILLVALVLWARPPDDPDTGHAPEPPYSAGVGG